MRAWGRRWSEGEDATLRRLAPKGMPVLVAALSGRSARAISRRAHRRRVAIARSHVRGWTEDENAVLRALARLGSLEVQKRLPHRTRTAICSQARRIGIAIPRGPRRRGWRMRVPCPETAHPLVRRLFDEMNREGVLLHELAELSGVQVQTISKWRYSVVPHLVGLIACLNALGCDLGVVRMREE